MILYIIDNVVIIIYKLLYNSYNIYQISKYLSKV